MYLDGVGNQRSHGRRWDGSFILPPPFLLLLGPSAGHYQWELLLIGLAISRDRAGTVQSSFPEVTFPCLVCIKKKESPVGFEPPTSPYFLPRRGSAYLK